MWKTLLCLLPVTAVALDLNPRSDFKELEGRRFPVISFEDPGKKIQWTPPTDWRMSYENGVLKLFPKALAKASMELRVVQRAAGDREALSSVEKLLPYCGKYLPSIAKGLAYRGNNPGPFNIGPLAAQEYLIDFTEGGQSCRASVSMLDYSDRQRLVVVITAQPKDFEAVRTEAMLSMNSWQTDSL
jgi:hypothetical protein